MSLDLNQPLNELCYLLECAALDYTGELKSELSILCDCIEGGEPPFDVALLQESLPQLRDALNLYRSGDKFAGSSKLASVSRDWWVASTAA